MRVTHLAMCCAVVFCGVDAHAQGYAQSYGQGSARASGDPCTPQAVSTNAMAALIGALGQQQRDRACVAERQAQWAEYNARQKAEHDKAETAAAAARAQAQTQAQLAARTAEEARDRAQAQALTQASRRHERALAASRAHEKAELARASSERQGQEEAGRAQRWHVELARAEQSPDNLCHQPKLARAVIDSWNGLETMKGAEVQVIDIEHMTTLGTSSGGAVVCHGVFVTNRGWRVVGTTTLKKNIAGDPIFVWERDADQDLSRYDASGEAASPDVHAGEPPARVTRVLSTGTPPPI